MKAQAFSLSYQAQDGEMFTLTMGPGWYEWPHGTELVMHRTANWFSIHRA